MDRFENALGLEAQRVSIAEYLCSENGVLCAEFTEVESGKRRDRPQLAAALAQCRLQGATLIVAKLDRLARKCRIRQQISWSRAASSALWISHKQTAL